MSKLIKEDFTFSCTVTGYTIYYKNKSIGGAGILGKYKGRGKAIQKQLADYRQQAEHIIAKGLEMGFPDYMQCN